MSDQKEPTPKKRVDKLNTYKETLEIISKIGNDNSNAPFDRIIVNGFLAGVFISFGCYLSIIIGYNNLSSSNINFFLGSLVYPLGFILIYFCNSDLLTINLLIITISRFRKEIKFWKLCRIYVLCGFGNIIGVIFVEFCFVYLIVNKGLERNKNWIQNLKEISDEKCTMKWYSMLLSGMAANWLICLAFFIATKATTSIGKVVCLWWPIFASVAMGFEHSIIYIPLGMMYGAENSNIKLFFFNLLIVTAGNIIGGCFFVAGVIYYIHYREGSWKNKLSELFHFLTKRGKKKEDYDEEKSKYLIPKKVDESQSESDDEGNFSDDVSFGAGDGQNHELVTIPNEDDLEDIMGKYDS